MGGGYEKMVQKVRCVRSNRVSNLPYTTCNYLGEANGNFKHRMKRCKKAQVKILWYKYQP